MMFFLGVTDVCATIIGGTFEGIFAIKGDIFCTNPNFMYLVGCFQVEVWVTACCASLLLLINRSLDLISGDYADLLFSGWKTYIWILFPFGFGLWMCWFTTPYLFSSLLHASFVNPYFGIPGINVTMSDYDDHYCVIFNYVVAGLFPALYVVLCVVLVIRTKGASSSNVIVSKIQKQIMIQSIVVSVFLALTSALYMLMQYIPVPMAIIIASQFMWQASHVGHVYVHAF
uniref:Rhodopsin n=1 Tax=Acrobeloides nanus TaxID=290746 RepID=A0A914CLZ3_9BILA